MKTLELRAERIRSGSSAKEAAAVLGFKLADSYLRKEEGKICFKPHEILKIAELFHLNLFQVNDIFFDGKLPVE